MKSVIDILEDRISAAMAAVTGRSDCAAIVRAATDPKFGDYQANGVMALAKKMKTDPRQLAGEVVKNLEVDDICEPPEVAGPGFINLRLKAVFIVGRLLEINKASANLGIERMAQPKTVVVDFSCPNIAKQMHVGHLRSTIIGDCICRILEFLGHKVIRQNHIGDWGTQFGMLIAYLRDLYRDKLKEPNSVSIRDLEKFYKAAKHWCDTDQDFAEAAREEVVKLHNNDKDTLSVWKEFVKESRRHYQPIYETLQINLIYKHERGESFYRDMLPDVVAELKKKNLAVESEGAVCVFPEGFKNKESERLPFMIQKSDGAYLYATTDLAAIRYRINELKADRIIYVTDTRQKLHFEMLFATARMAKWVNDDIELSHVMFGSVLGEDGAPLKTRSGENVKLKELLEEAVERAKAVVEEKNPDLDRDKKAAIATAVGIGAVKYADYSNNRTSDYIFSFDKMLAMDGNTAPYMQYAYARIKSIERKAEEKDIEIEKELRAITDLSLTEPAELDLAKTLSRYGEAVQATASDYRPNYLTAYLYELAQKFSGFYTNCPVLDAGPDKRPTRLLLCDLTAKTIKHGLSELLGIEVVEQM
ncbi:MAG: arginine--tRNA ligase [Planctomycetota bacterium]|jgi:arginyl-tRNA synthetase